MMYSKWKVAGLFFVLASPLFCLAQDKEALAGEVLQLWQVENGAIAVFQKTGVDVLRNTRAVVVAKIPEEAQAALMTEISFEVEQYLAELAPYVREQALDLKEAVFLPFLVENFDATELRELIFILESPVKKKLDTLLPTMQSEYELAVVEKSGARVKLALAELTERVNSTLRNAVSAP